MCVGRYLGRVRGDAGMWGDVGRIRGGKCGVQRDAGEEVVGRGEAWRGGAARGSPGRTRPAPRPRAAARGAAAAARAARPSPSSRPQRACVLDTPRSGTEDGPLPCLHRVHTGDAKTVNTAECSGEYSGVRALSGARWMEGMRVPLLGRGAPPRRAARRESRGRACARAARGTRARR